MDVRTLWVHPSAGAACGKPGLGLNANAVVTVSRAPQGMGGGGGEDGGHRLIRPPDTGGRSGHLHGLQRVRPGSQAWHKDYNEQKAQ